MTYGDESAIARSVAGGCVALALLTVACSPRSIPTPTAAHAPASTEAAAAKDDATTDAFRLRVIAGDGEAALKDLTDDVLSSSRARAWRVCAAAMTGRVEDARVWADELDLDDPWSTLARGCLLDAERSADALTQTAWGMKGLDGHEDIVWLRARVLARHAKRDELLELHRSLRPKLRDPIAAEVDLVVADSLADRDWVAKDGSLEQALAIAGEVRERSTSVRAYTSPARWLLRVGRVRDARPLAKEAVAIAPDDRKARLLLWDVLVADPDLSEDARRAAVEADVRAVVDRHGDDARLLFDAADTFGRIGLEAEREAMWARIEREHAGSETEGHVAWKRIDLLRERIRLQKHRQNAADPLVVAELKQRIARATAAEHGPAMWRGRAYVYMFSLLEEEGDAVDPTALLDAVEGMVAHEANNPHVKFGRGPRVLAQRTPHVRRALEIVELGFVDLEGRTFRDDAEREWMRVELHVTRALVLVAANRLDEADRELDTAESILGREVRILAARGAVAEKRGDGRAAVRWYVDCLEVETNPSSRPCTEALERIYVAKHGSRRGLRAHMDRARADAKAKRKAELLAATLAEERSLVPFELPSVQDRSVASASLRGKVSVVHFWATWCGFCVVEMKAIDALVAKYDRVRDVEIVLVSGDRDRHALQRWIAEHGFRFDTLIDDGYSHRAGIGSWPTTLFVDGSGRVRYEHKGAVADLVEEFSWRIEALRGAPRDRAGRSGRRAAARDGSP